MLRVLRLTVFILLLLLTLPPLSDAHRSARTTYLISKSYSGGIPNAPSRNAAISHDLRIGRVLAYESDASNIVKGDTNNATDVFMVKRKAPWGQFGSKWKAGKTSLISRGLDGKPANGPSYKPAIDGWVSRYKPHCVGFISEASNLVRGDTNGVADAFIYNLKNRRIIRVSVSASGFQTNTPVTEISVDGNCRRISIVTAATTFGKTNGKSQVFIKSMKTLGGSRGSLRMVSVNRNGKAANRDVIQALIAREGKEVAFATEASNLSSRDTNNLFDVYRTSFNGKPKTRLVSTTKSGRAGNGPSSSPAINDVGRYVVYQTSATNILPGDRNKVSDIVKSWFVGRHVKRQWVSKSYVGIADGASSDPVVTDGAEFVFFTSMATNLKPNPAVNFDRNGVMDVFLWNAPTLNTSLESRDWFNEYLTTTSRNPATSSKGNYMLFESADPDIDLHIKNRTGIEQVYMRYMGPK